MKRYTAFLTVICLSATVLLSSCLGDNTDDSMMTHAAASTLQRTASGENVFVTDDSITMHPEPSISADDSLIGNRYFVEFRLLEQTATDFDITLRTIQLMRTYEVEKTDVILFADDPVTPNVLWATGNYLNMLLIVDAEATAEHEFALYDVSGSGDKLKFELRHDKKGDTGEKNMRTALSFDISEYIEAAQGKPIEAELSFNVKDIGRSTYTVVINKDTETTSVDYSLNQ